MADPELVRHEDRWYTGKDKTFRVTVYQADGVTPQDITGWTLAGVLATKERMFVASLQSITLVTPMSGIFEATSPASQTRDLPGHETAEYWLEFRRTGSGVEDVVAAGPAVLRQSPTGPA